MTEIEGQPDGFGPISTDQRNLIVFSTEPAWPLVLVPNGGGAIVIHAGREVPLCTLRQVDGRWTAEYQPEDLDEAAQALMEAANLIAASGAGSGPSRSEVRDRLWAVRGMTLPAPPGDLAPYPHVASWQRGYVEALSVAARIVRGEFAPVPDIASARPRQAPEPGTAEHGSWKPEIFPIVDALRDVDWSGFDPGSLDDLAEVAALVLSAVSPPPAGPLLPEPTE